MARKKPADARTGFRIEGGFPWSKEAREEAAKQGRPNGFLQIGMDENYLDYLYYAEQYEDETDEEYANRRKIAEQTSQFRMLMSTKQGRVAFALTILAPIVALIVSCALWMYFF